MSDRAHIPPPTDGRRKVLVAMSGGVDSSVAAALLVEAGYDVVGCFMRLGSPGESLDRPTLDGAVDAQACEPGDRRKIGKQGCCSINDAADARLVAAQLGVPLYVVNFKREFGRIIDYFVDEYAKGRTPNPCVRCNDWLKFGRLHAYAEQLGCDAVASGHYARIGIGADGHAELWTGVDAHKDQSYVLFGSPQDQLAKMMLPIGWYPKAHVRAMAESRGLPVFDKPDSQEICFVPDNDYARLVEAERPELAHAGEIVDRDGNRLGVHGGQHRFTIGQRRKVGVALGYPIFVVDKDPASNTVTIGGADELESVGCLAAEPNWLIEPPTRTWQRCLAKFRSKSSAVAAQVRVSEEADGLETPSGRVGGFEIRFETPQRAVAPGQAIALYDADQPHRVLGGGWIARAITT
ncbi:MAG: tRNA 2-thiouridine(34) synthase MnmA [Planctomycetota bacterium]